jgi:hypothetical protein
VPIEEEKEESDNVLKLCKVHIRSLNFVIFGGVYPVILFCVAKEH